MLRRISLFCAVLLAAGCAEDVRSPRPAEPEPTGPAPRSDQQAFQKAEQVLQNRCDNETVGENPHLAAPVLTGASSHSNEVHDCQKLVVMAAGQPTFGPLVAIWPIADAADAEEEDFLGGMNVATVVNHGSMAYNPLGLAPTAIHCLRLTFDSATRTFSAVMFVPANQSEFCLANRPPEADEVQTVLEARVADQWPAGALPAAATARIGWSDPPDSESLSTVAGTPRPQHYLGVQCASSWCGVGPDGFAFATTQKRTSDTGAAVTPGYYDEQFIAVPVSPGQTGLKPGPWAVIQPTDDLHQQDTTSWMGGNHVVARVMVDRGGDPDAEAHILAMLRFRPTGLGSGASEPNQIRLQYHGSDQFSAEHRSRLPTGPDWDRIPSNLTFVKHRAHGVEGSVRWRWNANDESGWVNCDIGCCESRGLQ